MDLVVLINLLSSAVNASFKESTLFKLSRSLFTVREPFFSTVIPTLSSSSLYLFASDLSCLAYLDKSASLLLDVEVRVLL
jgi:hypothetical protein